jgi:hypothetical protein
MHESPPVKDRLVRRAIAISGVHLAGTLATVLAASYFQLARGQHGGNPLTLVEVVANVAGIVLMFPLALLVRVASQNADVPLIGAAIVVNSGACGFVLAKLFPRQRSR